MGLEPKDLKAIKDLTSSVSNLVAVLEKREKRDAGRGHPKRARGSEKTRDGPPEDSFFKRGIDGMD